jgi:preprotein translocase subunit SecG
MLTFFMVLLVVIDVFTALLLVGAILLQKSKDEGLGIAFGAGGMGESLFGSRTGNVLTKITIALAVIFLIDTMLIVKLSSRGIRRSIVERVPARESVPLGRQMPAAAPISEEAPAPAESAGSGTAPAGEAQPAPAAAPAN